MAEAWREACAAEYERRKAAAGGSVDFASGQVLGYPVSKPSITVDEVMAAVDTFLDDQFTMRNRVAAFEKEFAKRIGIPETHAVMVNSGSSSNLLMVAAAMTRSMSAAVGMGKAEEGEVRCLKPGDEVLVPSVCWSTSVFPLVQLGLKAVFVDVDPHTLNATMDTIRAATTERTRGMMVVHIMGNCAPMDELLAFAAERNWVVMEDTCEALSSTYNGKVLGTMGDFGSYSFHYTHHMTTGEGGMAVARTLEDADLLRSLREHGWTRCMVASDKSDAIVEATGKTASAQGMPVDSRFCFCIPGYNVRPMDCQGAIGLIQIKKLDTINGGRQGNYYKLRRGLVAAWLKQNGRDASGVAGDEDLVVPDDFPIEFMHPSDGNAGVQWFGLPMLVKAEHQSKLRGLKDHMTAKGIGNRPVVSGNFLRQPVIAHMLGLSGEEADALAASMVGADTVHKRGFFMGCPAELLSDDEVDKVTSTIISFFAAQE